MRLWNNLLRCCTLGLLFGGSLPSAWAQSDTSAIALAEVVIAADRWSGSLPWTAADSLGPDVLRLLDRQPGVFAVLPNAYPLSYRGQHGVRLRVERNGARRAGVTNQGYLAEEIDPGEVAQIQVIRGIERAAYGSGGFGGVIRIEEHNGLQAVPSQAYLRYQTNGQGLRYGGRVYAPLGTWRLLASAQRQTQQNLTYPSGTPIENSALQSHNASLALARPDPVHAFSWRQQFNSGWWQRPLGFQNNPNELRTYRNPYQYQTDVQWLHQTPKGYSLNHRVWGITLLAQQLYERYHGVTGALAYEETRDYHRTALGYRSTLEAPAQGPWHWRAGVDAYWARQDDFRSTYDLVSGQTNERVPQGRNLDFQAGGFAEATYRKARGWLKALLRADMARIGEAGQLPGFATLSGGMEGAWQFHPTHQWRTSLGRYFRYPTQQEAAGILYGGRGVFVGNPALVPEASYELETELQGQSGALHYALTGYAAYQTQRITEVLISADTFQYQNVDFARTWGLEAQVNYTFQPGWGAKDRLNSVLSGTAQWGDVLATTNPLGSPLEPLVGVPPARLRGWLDYTTVLGPSLTLTTHAQADYVFAYTRIPERFINQIWAVQPADAYWLVASSASLQGYLKAWRWELTLAVENLTNATYYPLGTRIAGPGRSFNLSLRVQR